MPLYTDPRIRIAVRRRARRVACAVFVAIAVASIPAGCASSRWVSLRSTPRNPLSDTLGLVTRTGPKPTPRTVQLLRRYNLEKKQGDRTALLAELSEINRREPSREIVYALSELAYVGAKRAEGAMKKAEALELYGDAVLYAHEYLFDKSYPSAHNEYDPEFRRACDLYNGALEGALRIVQSQDALRPGASRVIKTPNHTCELVVELKSKGWHAEDFDHVEFVSDYEVHGLTNHYHAFGLGVPLIAVRRHHENADPAEQFYPPDLSFAVTAFLRLSHPRPQQGDAAAVAPAAAAPGPSTEPAQIVRATLELYDPLETAEIDADGTRVPLETDLSTPLAHFLSQPALDEDTVSTLGLLHPDKAQQLAGLYMLEPYQPDKIPVVMVHGLWSSPVTWMEMFNDLRSDPAIRKNYQFWFYLYPSGQPFWFSAAQMREDLAHLRTALDPQRGSPALDQMVLVGHSMGGLVSKLQTIDSGNEFWRTLSDKPFADLNADPEVRDGLAEAFFFDPNPSIRRVITIGTPHRGSAASNNLTKYLGSKLISAPSKIMHFRSQLVTRNPDYFRPGAPLDVTNAIDSLSPKSPILPVLLEASAGPWVKYHNIIGQQPKKGVTNGVTKWLSGDGDGVVTLDSAKLDNAMSQKVVTADHQHVHRNPESIYEVRRILREHIAELESVPYGGGVNFASSQEPAAPWQPPLPTPGPVAAVPVLEPAK